MKYIIKNCPAYDYDEEFNYHICKQPLVPYECSVDNCQDITDCVMKRIVNECRNELEKRNAYSVGIHYDFAREILKFVEIEEAE